MNRTTTTLAAPGGFDWLLAPFFLLRVGGLPADVVTGLRFPRTVRWAQEQLALEESLAARAPGLADALEHQVGGEEDEHRRRDLLRLRRDVFNQRAPRDPAAAAGLVRTLPEPLRAELAGWLDLAVTRAARAGLGQSIVDDELPGRRAALRALADDPSLRHGVLLASPSLDRHLPSYLAAPPGPLGKRARRIERSVLEYVYRTACKTSPFSTLTPVALGRFGPAPSPLTADLDGAPRSHTRLNLAVLGRLAELVVNNPELRPDLPVRLTSGLRAEAERLRYVRRTRRPGEEDAAVTMDMLSETLFYLSTSTFTADLLTALPDGAELGFAELAERLRALDPEGRAPAEVETYLHHLLRLGLLTVPPLHVDIHHPDPVRCFRDGIARIGRQWSAALAKRLDTVADRVDRYPEAGLDERRALLDGIRDELVEAQRELGRPDAAAPRTLVYEDTSLATEVVADGAEWAEKLLPPLRGLAGLLPLFDMMLTHRLATTGFFRARHGSGGRCEDVLRFVHEFDQDFYDQFTQVSMRRRPFDEDNAYVPHENWFRLPEIEALDRARVELVRRMRGKYRELPAGAGELVLDEEFVNGVLAEMPPVPGDLAPHCFFLQLADDGGRPLAVVNRCYSGLTLLYSRFAHCFPDGFTEDLRTTLARVCPEDTVFAELKGGFETTNLNLHPRVTPYELVCPGDLSSRPPPEQIPIEDLYIVDDGERLRLRSRRLGVAVVPLYLGFLMPFALPSVQRMLLLFAPAGMAQLDLWSGTDEPLGDRPVGGHPRVRYGQVVLQRALWKTSPDRVPVREPGQSEADHFLAWNRWARRHGLPRRVFVTPDLTAAAPSAEAGPARLTTKPLYVDFDSCFSLTLLDTVAKAANRRLVFTEMLPDTEALWPGTGGRVTELVVELDGVRRRTR